MLVKSEGVVLRNINYSEADKILTIFTKQNGKVQAIAKGARKYKNNLVASTQTFCYSNFLMYEGKNFYHINQGEVIDSFFSLREDLEKLAYATYIIELIDAGTLEGESNPILFDLLIKTLQVLTNIEKDYKNLLLAFELKYISFIGYKPQLKRCVSCESDFTNNIKFSVAHGGALCENCFNIDANSKSIDLMVLNKMKELLYLKLDEISNIKINNKEANRIEYLLLRYITSHLDKKNFKSLEFIKSLEGK